MSYLAHSAKGEVLAQSYLEHISEVSRRAGDNAARIAPYTKYGQILQNVAKYASLFHDMGKLDDENQKVLRTGKGKLPINHVDGGVAHLLARTSVLGYLSALIAYSHHLGLPFLPDEDAKGTGKKFRDEKLKALTDKRLSKYLEMHTASVGLSEIPDMGTSSTPPLLIRMALSCLVDADHTDTARHYNNIVPEGEILLSPFKRLELLDRYVEGLGSAHGENARNDLRKRVYAACRNAKSAASGIIACDSPVGTGKTTAVMAHLLNVAQAQKKNLRRIFVVLPFTNIIDQSVEVYRKSLVMEGENAEKVVAAHHHRAEFEDLETRAFSFLWNAPITVTTAVQFFETLSSNHPAALRKLHQLPGSAIFLDEAHAALPAHLWPQAWKWLRELAEDWGCYVVMASGSLTRFWELEEFSSPIKLDELVKEDVRQEAHNTERTRITYRPRNGALGLAELSGWVQGLSGPRLVIFNTVQSAAAVAEELAGEARKHRDKVEHISTALAPIHRERTICRIKERLRNKEDTDWTLVATSCVEAGMDFSFRTAAREFCSLVSTIQTAGRINRSGEFHESDLWNFKIIPGERLKEHPKFRASATILEDLFKERKVSAEFCKEAMKREVRQNNQVTCDDNHIVKLERKRDFPEVEDKFRVIDNNTMTVVVDDELRCYIEDGERIPPSVLQRNTVNVYSHLESKYALKSFYNYPGLYWWTLKYDDFIGYMAGVFEIIRHQKEGTVI